MGSLFDDVMAGAKAAEVFFKGAKKVGKLAMDGVQKLNESEKFQELKAEVQDKLTNSETLNNLKTEVQQRINQFSEGQKAGEKKICPQCGTALEESARFCSYCGAAQPQEEPAREAEIVDLPQEAEETAAAQEPEVCEAKPTVLENKEEQVEVLFQL